MKPRPFLISVAVGTGLVASVPTPLLTQQQQADFRWPTPYALWNAVTADLDHDGSSELVVATMDGAKFNQLTSKTPLFVLGVVDERVVDRSADFFETPPTSWNATLATGDFDADGAADIMICDRGRNVGPNPPQGSALTDGMRGAQNEVLLNRGGKLRLTDGFPRLVTSSWGCSAGDIDRSGRASIAMMSWYSDKGHDAAFVLTWDMNSRFVQTHTLSRAGDRGFGATATADFDGNGYADIAGGTQFFLSGPNGLGTARPLAESVVELEGYRFWRTTVTADFTGDGLADVVKVNSKGEPTLSEARFAMYRGDRSGGLVEKRDAFPATAAYNGNDYSQRVVAIDLDFDGSLDLAPLGKVYTSFSDPGRPADAVWLNDGSGRFRQARWTDAIQSFPRCDLTEAYFLPTADPLTYHLIYGGCSQGYIARTVSDTRRLTFN
ncbi:MAG: VCBS repeat-containing protein [Acidobacteriota bacterium]|nr:VCBS repeat-containing protein [Acidobacteriota bacterium]